jgi:hypothetical protein
MDARLGKFSSVAEVECVDVYLKTILYLTTRLGQGLEIGSCELPQRGQKRGRYKQPFTFASRSTKCHTDEIK